MENKRLNKKLTEIERKNTIDWFDIESNLESNADTSIGEKFLLLESDNFYDFFSKDTEGYVFYHNLSHMGETETIEDSKILLCNLLKSWFWGAFAVVIHKIDTMTVRFKENTYRAFCAYGSESKEQEYLHFLEVYKGDGYVQNIINISDERNSVVYEMVDSMGTYFRPCEYPNLLGHKKIEDCMTAIWSGDYDKQLH